MGSLMRICRGSAQHPRMFERLLHGQGAKEPGRTLYLSRCLPRLAGGFVRSLVGVSQLLRLHSFILQLSTWFLVVSWMPVWGVADIDGRQALFLQMSDRVSAIVTAGTARAFLGERLKVAEYAVLDRLPHITSSLRTNDSIRRHIQCPINISDERGPSATSTFSRRSTLRLGLLCLLFLLLCNRMNRAKSAMSDKCRQIRDANTPDARCVTRDGEIGS